MTPRQSEHRSGLRVVRSGWMDGLRQDVVYVARSLARSPGLTAAIVITLALGLGTNAAIFSFLDQVFLQAPAGVASPGRVHRLWIEQPRGNSRVPSISQALSYHEYRVLDAALADQAQLALYALRTAVPLGRGDASATATVAYTTANYFTVLGVQPMIGRAFADAEADVHAPSRVVVISDAFWHRELGAASGAVGTMLTIDGHQYAVVGIAPAHFSGIDLQHVDLWLPLGTFPTHNVGRAPFWESNATIAFSAFGRWAPHADRQVLEARATDAFRHTPRTDFSTSPTAQLSFRSIIEARGPGSRPQEVTLAVRLAVVAIIILFIAGANAINLLLARAMARRREVAVRLALGISRARLARLFVVEGVLLSLAAGAAAVLSAQTTAALVRGLLLPGTEFADGSLSWHVIAFTVGLSLIAGIVAGLVPALQATEPDLARSLRVTLREGVQGRALLPKALVGAQAALSVLLLVGAALCVLSLTNIEQLHIGFDVPRLAYASVQFPAGARPDTVAFTSGMRAAGERLRGAPGVEAVAFAWDEPMRRFGTVKFYTATDSSDSGTEPVPTGSYVSADYFKAIGVPVLRGRSFGDQAQGNSAAAVVVNQTLARTFWPGQDPIGQCIYLQTRQSPCATIVGVVGDAIRERLTEQRAPQLYLPIFQSMRGARPPQVMVIRADPKRLAAVMAQTRSTLRQAFPGGEPGVVRMADRLAPQYHPWELGASLFSVFGGLAMVIAGLGIYSTVSYSVTQRVHELGVRMALGADAADLMRDVIGRGLRPVMSGAVVGAVLSLAGGRFVASRLYGTAPWNPAVIASVVLTLLGAGLVAASIPAWRAAHIDPVRTLNAD